MILLLTLLIIIPIASYRWAKSRRPDYKITILSISFGAIAAPFSMGLYATFFIPVIGLPTGMLGLIMVMFHTSIGYQVAIYLELMPSGVVTTGSSNVIIAIIYGFAWGVIYGAFGYLIDKYRNNKQNPNKTLKRDSKKTPRPLARSLCFT